jgi:HNH endonuclease
VRIKRGRVWADHGPTDDQWNTYPPDGLEDYRVLRRRELTRERVRRWRQRQKTGEPRAPFARERFWELVDQSAGLDACWPWMGTRNPSGYGKLRLQGSHHDSLAHRYAYELTYGAAPEFVLHRCDNPPCCNPAHLVSGSPAANVRDMFSKRRGRPYGKTQRFTCAEAEAIRLAARDGEPVASIARRLQSPEATVGNIVRGLRHRDCVTM